MVLSIINDLCIYLAVHAQGSQLASKYPLPSIANEKPLAYALEGSTLVLPCWTTCNCTQKSNLTTSWIENNHKVSIPSSAVLPSGALRIANVSAGSLAGKIFRCIASAGSWSVVGVGRTIQVIGMFYPDYLNSSDAMPLPI